jgi:hypothetical protein
VRLCWASKRGAGRSDAPSSEMLCQRTRIIERSVLQVDKGQNVRTSWRLRPQSERGAKRILVSLLRGQGVVNQAFTKRGPQFVSVLF